MRIPFAIASTLLLATAAHASLIDRGNGLIYDTDLNVTWLQDANLAASNTFGVTGLGGLAPGLSSIDRAGDWLSAMNAAQYKGYGNWRLPTVAPSGGSFTPLAYSYSGPDWGYNTDTSASELAHLYYVSLGNLGGHAADGAFNCVSCLQNTGPFINVQPWLYATASSSAYDIAFNMDKGYQGAYIKNAISAYFWAVRDGDVAVTALPEPPAVLLMLTGLAFFARRPRRVLTPRP